MLDPRRLCQLEIPVTDFERALAFYAAAFGWQPSLAEMHDYVVLQVPEGCPFGISLVRMRPAGEEPAASPPASRSGAVAYFAVDDPEAIIRAVEAAGGRKRFGPLRLAGYGRAFQVEDPDGNRWGLFVP